MEGDWGAGAIFRPGAYLVEVCEADVHLSHTCSSGQLPRIRQQSGAAPHQGICSIDPAVPRTCPHRPLPSLPSTSCPRIRHLQLLLQETDRMPLLV